MLSTGRFPHNNTYRLLTKRIPFSWLEWDHQFPSFRICSSVPHIRVLFIRYLNYFNIPNLHLNYTIFNQVTPSSSKLLIWFQSWRTITTSATVEVTILPLPLYHSNASRKFPFSFHTYRPLDPTSEHSRTGQGHQSSCSLILQLYFLKMSTFGSPTLGFKLRVSNVGSPA